MPLYNSLTNFTPDVKPNNVFLNWYVHSSDEFHLEKVVLGDMDCALRLKGKTLLNYRIGNVMRRSPEGQIGKGVGKPSEVFSFALLVSPMFSWARICLLSPPYSASMSLRECNLSI